MGKLAIDSPIHKYPSMFLVNTMRGNPSPVPYSISQRALRGLTWTQYGRWTTLDTLPTRLQRRQAQAMWRSRKQRVMDTSKIAAAVQFGSGGPKAHAHMRCHHKPYRHLRNACCPDCTGTAARPNWLCAQRTRTKLMRRHEVVGGRTRQDSCVVLGDTPRVPNGSLATSLSVATFRAHAPRSTNVSAFLVLRSHAASKPFRLFGLQITQNLAPSAMASAPEGPDTTSLEAQGPRLRLRLSSAPPAPRRHQSARNAVALC